METKLKDTPAYYLKKNIEKFGKFECSNGYLQSLQKASGYAKFDPWLGMICLELNCKAKVVEKLKAGIVLYKIEKL